MKYRIAFSTFVSFLIVLCSSCNDSKAYVNINQFKITPDAVKDGDSMMIFYSSGGPEKNGDLAFYYHVIGVSKSTKDTVNILVTTIDGLMPDDNERVFIPQSSITYKAIVGTREQKGINKVVFNQKKKTRELNKYKTVIGELAKVTSDTSQALKNDGIYQLTK